MKPLLKTGASISTLETQNFPVKSTLPANLGYHIVDSSQFGYYPDEDKIKEMTKERHYALVLAAQACTAAQLRVVLHWAIRSHKDQYL
ncbi:hypothetical protein F9C07_2236657 [Aspergillus flavus]|uniref:Uncharacterized protein n=1 Tax=Aspergillus flavus (strain ATCC 200026 / FGSC A1120 / IAM 13836 / NRRL 3357 / JCM 12722 / SRRC 167) TaxID=332952 RepID=A0A7U2R2S7_ASPFN|nr:hypothetical protein F9C07_2236657 [Aspergillus flavus]